MAIAAPAAVSAIAAARTALPAVSAQAGSAGPVAPRLSWADCGDGFECTTAQVPLDYDRPRGSTISLALVRLPASDPGHRIGSLFINPGGPGGSGAEFVRDAGRVLYSSAVRSRFDLVGFDPRGIIGSTPLRCFATFEESIAQLTDFAFPVTPAEERATIRSDRAISAACARHGGAILDHMSTANVARDLDLLRQAVGDAKLSYAGYSYGSYLGTTYANLFPGKVRALVVDGVLDPVAWATGRGREARTLPFSSRLGSNDGSWASLKQFFRLCDAAGARCDFSAGSPRRHYARLAARLLKDPLQLDDGAGGTVPFRYSDLVSITLGALYDPTSWPDLAAFLADLESAAGAPATGAGLRALRAKLGNGLQQEDYPNFVEGGVGVFCSETDNPHRVSAWKRAARAADLRTPYFGRPWTWLSSICQPWPGRDADRYAGPWNHRTSEPVLVVGNRYDPATPYRGAVAVDRLLPRSRLLTLDGWGHTSLFASACVDRYVNRYLLTSRVPAAGTVCRPDAVPFAAAVTMTAAERTGRAQLVPAPLRRAIRN
jgi:pimeloyl-ACP methyl ester carboxylesterase